MAALIESANTYRTRTVESVRGSALRFEGMLALHDENPGLYRHRQVQDALEKIFAGDVQAFFPPPRDDRTLYLELPSPR